MHAARYVSLTVGHIDARAYRNTVYLSSNEFTRNKNYESTPP